MNHVITFIDASGNTVHQYGGRRRLWQVAGVAVALDTITCTVRNNRLTCCRYYYYWLLHGEF